MVMDACGVCRVWDYWEGPRKVLDRYLVAGDANDVYTLYNYQEGPRNVLEL